jgi:1-phosphatidylinositol-3-phosphate 5-kinase
LETWVKSAGIMGSKGKVPTVISPKLYKRRFKEAMDGYFVLTPDKFTGLIRADQEKQESNQDI